MTLTDLPEANKSPFFQRSQAELVLWLHLWTEHYHISLAGATKNSFSGHSTVHLDGPFKAK